MKITSLIRTHFALSVVLSLGIAVAPVWAGEHDHHHMEGLELQFNNGQKWETDASLRQAMGLVGQSLNKVLGDIHHHKLNAAGYEALATEVNKQVVYMIENCELEPTADEQLHIVIARMMVSAQGMEQSSDINEKRQAAVQLMGALNSYATYFNDEDFVKPKHNQ